MIWILELLFCDVMFKSFEYMYSNNLQNHIHILCVIILKTANVNILVNYFMFSNMWAYMYLCIDLYRYIIQCNQAVTNVI